MHDGAPTVPPRGHLAVVVPDFEATLARLHEHGFETRPPARTLGRPAGQRHRPRRPPRRADGRAPNSASCSFPQSGGITVKAESAEQLEPHPTGVAAAGGRPAGVVAAGLA